jgi:diadenylate cyclase|uniref:DNA integrity scanning protein DisA n=1 Tax=Mesoaciditoga lauensis TaxID=1495039 RepID=A0A7V3REA4_9BACT
MFNDENVKNFLEMVAPGTSLREALDNIIRADKGALIFFVQDPQEYIESGVIQGGFELKCPFNQNRLYELAKMDGAIVISEDLKTIWYANVQLAVDSSIPTNETGTRHRTAERIAMQTGKLIISVSQRRKVITLYRGNWKYMVNDVSVVVLQINQSLRLMERYRTNFDNAISSIDLKEMEKRVTLFDVFEIVDRGVKMLRLSRDLSFYLSELGNTGTFIKLHLDELLNGVEDNLKLFLMDYADEKVIGKDHDVEALFESILSQKWDENLDPLSFANEIGYDIEEYQMFEMTLQPRGYRILRNIPRIPISVAHDVIKKFSDLYGLLDASFEDLMSVDGIAEKRATIIMSGISSLKNRLNYIE